MSSSPQLIKTSDGSHSIYLADLKETYHSSHGAITESQHVFIDAGLDFYYQEQNHKIIKIFEVGFGTGLNALLAYQWSVEHGIRVVYHTIELYPLAEPIYKQLNYGELLQENTIFRKIHSSSWEEEIQLSDNFIIKKINEAWIEYTPSADYHVIFYDAFAPGKQPEMWSVDLLKKCFTSLSKRGVLVTYCAQGQFKRDLVTAGFNIETLQGPPGKKEMVRGVRV